MIGLRVNVESIQPTSPTFFICQLLEIQLLVFYIQWSSLTWSVPGENTDYLSLCWWATWIHSEWSTVVEAATALPMWRDVPIQDLGIAHSKVTIFLLEVKSLLQIFIQLLKDWPCLPQLAKKRPPPHVIYLCGRLWGTVKMHWMDIVH